MKRFLCSFLTNTLPTLNVPLHSCSFSLLDPSCMPCCCAGWPVGLTRVKRTSSSVVLTGSWKHCVGVVFYWSHWGLLYDMSDQSSMDRGDPLGDRFWLSPKKGKMQTKIDYDTILQKKAGHSEWMVVSIGWMKVYVMKRCGHIQTITHFWQYGVK